MICECVCLLQVLSHTRELFNRTYYKRTVLMSTILFTLAFGYILILHTHINLLGIYNSLSNIYTHTHMNPHSHPLSFSHTYNLFTHIHSYTQTHTVMFSHTHTHSICQVIWSDALVPDIRPTDHRL